MKSLSLIICVYIAWKTFPSQPPTADWIQSMIFFVFLLSCIWFPEALGDYVGGGGDGPFIDKKSPAIIVRIVAWLMLIGVFIAILLNQ